MPALTLTLSTPASVQRIIDLIRATAGYANTSLLCNYLVIRGHDDLGAAFVYEGGSGVSSTNYGTRLGPGDSRAYQPSAPGESTDLAKYVIGSAGGLKIDVEWQSF